jgi:hypothetical protein
VINNDVTVKCRCRRRGKKLPQLTTSTTHKPTEDDDEIEFDDPSPRVTTTMTPPTPPVVQTAGEWPVIPIVTIVSVLVLVVIIIYVAKKKCQRARRNVGPNVLLGDTTMTSHVSSDSSTSSNVLYQASGNVTHLFLFFT